MFVRRMALRHADPKRTKRDRWVCRDDAGLLHMAMIMRFYDLNDALHLMQASTACDPVMHQLNVAPDSGFVGQHLPRIGMKGFILVEYNVREVPTCLQCWARSSTVFE